MPELFGTIVTVTYWPFKVHGNKFTILLESPLHYSLLLKASISSGNSINSNSYPFKGIGVLKLILRSAG